MKINDLYEEEEFLTDKNKILIWMEESFHQFDPNFLEIESDGLVYDGFLTSITDINKLKVQFKEVTGYFNCSHTSISDLKGCPQSVGGYFTCSSTNITSLKFCPKSVGAHFSCGNNKITNPREYRFALYCEISDRLYSGNEEIDNIINTYGGTSNKKHWPVAINLLSKVQL